MGLIKTIKESFARARALGMQAKAELEEAARCRAMTRAESCRKLFHDFVTENEIDITRLDSFAIDRAEDFAAQNERYPFDDFDEDYYQLYEREPLDALCAAYVRGRLEDFFER